MAAAEGWTPRRDNPYAGPGDEGLDDAAPDRADVSPDPDVTRMAPAGTTPDTGGDTEATRLAVAPDTVVVPDPGATRVYDRAVGDASAVDPTVYSRAAALERSQAAGGRTRP